MKLQFEPNQQYQLDAIKAVVDIFNGQPLTSGRPDVFSSLAYIPQESLFGELARSNELLISLKGITDNVHDVQKKHELSQSSGLVNDMNFSIEMETGTGKTYVYLRTIHELHERYGWKKFIIVVPSVAIREGVLKNLEITREHFAELYSKPEMNYYVWDSKKTGQAREFATNDTLQIMVITIDSFAKAENIMNKESDNGRPLDYIKATHPVVIIDEPQNMETEVRKTAIASLNPLCTLRYSATHKHLYNMLYRLTPVDAYDKGLVKKIEVHSILSEDSYNDAFISVLKLEYKNKSNLLAHIELDKSDERGLQRQTMKLGPGSDLSQITGRSIYEGYIIESINFADQAVEFANGKIVYVGQKDEGLHDDIIKKQIELTVEDHFKKQLKFSGRNIKVLSLFFIDRVANYREYTDTGLAKGKFAVWFEEAYAKVSQKPKYIDIMKDLSAESVHNGYFAADKSGKWKDSRDTKGEGGNSKDDDDAYSLIMKDKERLLDMNEPLRFIFSHSALREGWDNPNVFNICTLNESSSEMKKRQEIGRGLRLPVDSDGERIRDENVNVLTVIANESYADFSRKLQSEIEEETGVSFTGRIKNRDERRRVKLTKNLKLDENFKELWEKIKHKTMYRVNIDVDALQTTVTELLKEEDIAPPQISTSRTIINTMTDGFSVAETPGSSYRANQAAIRIPNVVDEIQKRTALTRRVIFGILDHNSMFEKIPINPQQVIDVVSRAIERAKSRVMLDGIKYEKTNDTYNMELFDNPELESYLYNEATKSGAVAIPDSDKTVYDHVVVDSEVELNFMKSLEEASSVKFYVKLPSWFKIDTPLGTYNPDWAIALEGDEKIYFVAETKGSDDLHDEHLGAGGRGRILAARQHFAELNVPYVAPVATLPSAIRKAEEQQSLTETP